MERANVLLIMAGEVVSADESPDPTAVVLEVVDPDSTEVAVVNVG